MILTIFGATGMVGKQIVKQALYKGHTVKAFGRNVFTAGFREDEKLELVQGALFDEHEVQQAVHKSDAVLSALGGAADGTDITRTLGIKNIITQMQKENIKRIIAVGGMGVLNNANDEIILDTPSYPPEYLAVGQEHYKAYEYLKASSLEWTFVCPPDIIDGEATGIYHTAANYLPEPNNNKINSGDLSLFMLNELTKRAYIKQRVGISN